MYKEASRTKTFSPCRLIHKHNEGIQFYVGSQFNPINSQCKTSHAYLFYAFITVVKIMSETTRIFQVTGNNIGLLKMIVGVLTTCHTWSPPSPDATPCDFYLWG
jgi:hypothetical protein